MKKLSVKFYLKPSKTSSTHNLIYVRIIYNRKKAEISTGFKTPVSDWLVEKEECKNNQIINRQLVNLKSRIYKIKDKLDDSEMYYEVSHIKEELNGTTNGNYSSLIEYYQEVVSRKRLTLEIGSTTERRYGTTLNYVKAFLKSIKKEKMMVQHVDLSFIKEFDSFLANNRNEFGDVMKLVTKSKHHSLFRTILHVAVKEDKLSSNPYKSFSLSFPYKEREYLTKNELDKLIELDLSAASSLDKARDIFLFSCYTGLRYQDAQDATMEDVFEDRGQRFIRIDQQKTDERREIPLLNSALQLVEKYDESKERIVKNKILPSMSNQKVNMYLKMVAELAGIKKRLTHHIARHTCATSVLLDNEMPLETVSHWLGHNSIKTTQIYAKISKRNLINSADRLNKLV